MIRQQSYHSALEGNSPSAPRSERERWREYETRKAALAPGLSAAEYAAACRRIAAEVRV